MKVRRLSLISSAVMCVLVLFIAVLPVSAGNSELPFSFKVPVYTDPHTSNQTGKILHFRASFEGYIANANPSWLDGAYYSETYNYAVHPDTWTGPMNGPFSITFAATADQPESGWRGSFHKLPFSMMVEYQGEGFGLFKNTRIVCTCDLSQRNNWTWIGKIIRYE